MMSVTKEFHRLLKRVGKLTDGQASIADIDWDDGILTKFYVTITPNHGFYKSGNFKFEVNIPDKFPEVPPVVWCHTEIYHPNIDPTEPNWGENCTNVCLNVLESGTWNSSFGLEVTILGLLFLMHNPNLQDPLSPYFGSDDEENFEDNVKKYMAGVQFDDMTFDKDFIVIDGILIEDTVASARADVQNGVDVPRTIDYPEDTKIINDVISIADLKISDNDGHSTDEIVNKTSLNDANIPKIELIKAQHIEDNEEMIKDLNTETIKGVTDCQGTGDTVSDDNAEDDYESNDFDIQLVNVDGDCLLIHRGKTNADEINDETNEQDTDNMTEAIQNELPPENNEEGEVNSQIEVSNSYTNEMKNKVCANAACNFTASNYTCDIEDENVGSYSQENKNDAKTLISDTHVETNVQFKDNPSHDSYINIGTWYTIMTVLSKIVLKRNRYKL